MLIIQPITRTIYNKTEGEECGFDGFDVLRDSQTIGQFRTFLEALAFAEGLWVGPEENVVLKKVPQLGYIFSAGMPHTNAISYAWRAGVDYEATPWKVVTGLTALDEEI